MLVVRFCIVRSLLYFPSTHFRCNTRKDKRNNAKLNEINRLRRFDENSKQKTYHKGEEGAQASEETGNGSTEKG